MLKEFKEFAVKGNVVDMAIGIMIGGAFGTVVKSVVDDLVMPPVGLVTGGLDFASQFVVLQDGKVPPPYASVEAAKEAGAVTLRYGVFINNLLAFLILAVVLFLVVRWINRLRRPPPPPNTRACPFCKSDIDKGAIRCAFCTSEVEPEPAS
jgi:large conductance mechanosensitive channel